MRSKHSIHATVRKNAVTQKNAEQNVSSLKIRITGYEEQNRYGQWRYRIRKGVVLCII